eukprot:356902-Prymnesium_polylepis.1
MCTFPTKPRSVPESSLAELYTTAADFKSSTYLWWNMLQLYSFAKSFSGRRYIVVFSKIQLENGDAPSTDFPKAGF